MLNVKLVGTRRQGRAMVTKCRVEALSEMLRVCSAMSCKVFVSIAGNVSLRFVGVIGKLKTLIAVSVRHDWKEDILR